MGFFFPKYYGILFMGLNGDLTIGYKVENGLKRTTMGAW